MLITWLLRRPEPKPASRRHARAWLRRRWLALEGKVTTPRPKLGKLSLLLPIGSIVGGFLLWWTWPTLSDEIRKGNWRSNFSEAISQNEIVSLGALVQFDFECVFFLNSQDFTAPMLDMIDPRIKHTRADYSHDSNYIYIAYRRKDAAPFIVALPWSKYALVRQAHLTMCDQNAKVRAVNKERCPRSDRWNNRICLEPIGIYGVE